MTSRGVPTPGDRVDARADRIGQSAVGVLVLAAFVFRVPWLLPVVAILCAIGAWAGADRNPFHRAFALWIEPRLPAADPPVTVALATVQRQDALGAIVLFAASVVYVAGLSSIAWVLAIAEGVVAILAATTGIHLAERLLRLRRR